MWKDIQKSSTAAEADDDTSDDSSSVASSASGAGGPDFNYLLSMSLLSLSREKKEELLKERDNKVCLRAYNSLTGSGEGGLEFYLRDFIFFRKFNLKCSMLQL